MDRSNHQVSPEKPNCENELANRNPMESENQKRELSHLHLMSTADPTGRNILVQFQQEEVSINTLQFSRIQEEFLLPKP